MRYTECMTDTATENVRFMDFSDDRPPLRFAANGHQYDCHPALSIPALQELGTSDVLTGDMEAGKVLEGLDAFFAMVMDADNAARIQAHMRDKANPLTATQATRVMRWIVQEYTARPLESSED